MAEEKPRPISRPDLLVTRRFDGGKAPEDVLRALIQAHQPRDRGTA